MTKTIYYEKHKTHSDYNPDYEATNYQFYYGKRLITIIEGATNDDDAVRQFNNEQGIMPFAGTTIFEYKERQPKQKPIITYMG